MQPAPTEPKPTRPPSLVTLSRWGQWRWMYGQWIPNTRPRSVYAWEKRKQQESPDA